MATFANVVPFPTLKVLQCSDCNSVVMLPQATEVNDMILVFCDADCENNFKNTHQLQDEWEHMSA